jgi:hypothetical protein
MKKIFFVIFATVLLVFSGTLLLNGMSEDVEAAPPICSQQGYYPGSEKCLMLQALWQEECYPLPSGSINCETIVFVGNLCCGWA